MKQYLEELRKKAEASWEGCHGCNQTDKQMWINGYITGALANQLELPSDEEIEKARPITLNNPQITQDLIWMMGAKWMKQQILNQNK